MNLHKDGNSTINQQIKRKLVEREVICNLNQVILHIQENGAGDWEDELHDILYSYDYEGTLENHGAESSEDENGETVWTYEDEEFIGEASEACDFFNLEPQINEVYEFWGVSYYLADKLRDNGETVVEILGFNVWGRCTTGQAILLDGVITRIAYDMEILDGQKYSWSENA